MIRNPGFFDAERESTLFIRNYNYLKPGSIDQVLDRVRDWPSRLGISDTNDQPFLSLEPIRIITHDAERTFKTKPNQERLVDILTQFHHETDDYHQAICAVTSFLLLFFDDLTAKKMITHLHQNVLKNYWRAEAVNFATDAYVFERLLEKKHPKVAAHIQKLGLLPETFCQKWFLGLCVHVLPFESLVSYYESFFTEGFPFLIKFGLSIVDIFEKEILTSSNSSKVFQMFRLDENYIQGEELIEMANRIIENTSRINLPHINYDLWREEIYLEKLKSRLDRAKLAAQNQEEEEEEEEEDAGDDAEGECQICNENYFDYTCNVCQKIICHACHKASSGGHLKSHPVVERD